MHWTVRHTIQSGTLAIHLLASCLSAVSAQKSAEPVQAEFLKPLQVHDLAPGATVFAKVTVDWNSPGCILHSGAVLEATIEASQPRKESSRSTLAPSFRRAQCNGTGLQVFPLVVVAAAVPPEDWEAVPDVDINSPRLRAHAGGEPTAVTDQPMFQTLGQHLEFTGVAHHFPTSWACEHSSSK